MIFPIGDDQVHKGYWPLFSYGLLLVNLMVFLWQLTMNGLELQLFFLQYGAIPVNITQGKDWYTLLTSLFIHGGWMHLLGNMVFLWVFADNIEATIGNVSFLFFYLLGGVAASALQIYMAPHSQIPGIGASGAVAAALGAYLVMYPNSRIRTLVIFFFIRIPAFLFLGIWIVQQFVSGIGTLHTLGLQGGVAWWAHIGGFGFGLIAGLFFRFVLKRRGTLMA